MLVHRQDLLDVALGVFFLGSPHLACCALAQRPEGSVFWPRAGGVAVALGSHLPRWASVVVSSLITWGWARWSLPSPVPFPPVTVEAPRGQWGHEPSVLWSLTGAGLPQSCPCGLGPAGPDPQSACFLGELCRGERNRWQGVWRNSLARLGRQVPPVVQRELLVLVSGFLPLFILASNTAPVFLDVVVRIVFAITGKAEKNGS